MTAGSPAADARSSARSSFSSTLLDAGRTLNLDLTGVQYEALLDYLDLLAKWNRVYNLTAVREPRAMLVQHVLDSLSIVPAVAARRPRAVLDVGSGGGLPGMVLAIALPACQFTLNDIVQKKTAFLTQAKGQLKLSNVEVVTGRVESLTREAVATNGFDVIVSRAFAELGEFVGLARHLLAPNGVILGMKGKRPDDEIARLPASASVSAVTPLHVPYLDAQRHLVEIHVESP